MFFFEWCRVIVVYVIGSDVGEKEILYIYGCYNVFIFVVVYNYMFDFNICCGVFVVLVCEKNVEGIGI